MTAINNNNYGQVYNIREDEALHTRVALVICLMIPRGMLVAGFSITKELLTIQYAGYNKNKPVWAVDFFEQLFASEPLLTAREKVKGIFISNNKNIIVPDELYTEQDAKNWLKHLYFVEAGDTINIFPLDSDKARYLYAIPVDIAELIKINFRKTPLVPLPFHHFNMEQVHSLYLQCTITADQVTATLHNYSQLLWHKVFDYSCAEDIAYEIKLLCKENYIDAAKLNIVCNTLCASEYDIVNNLTQYFPGIKAGNGLAIHERWDPAISLVHQLSECVL
jgi:hypothetical protein